MLGRRGFLKALLALPAVALAPVLARFAPAAAAVAEESSFGPYSGYEVLQIEPPLALPAKYNWESLYVQATVDCPELGGERQWWVPRYGWTRRIESAKARMKADMERDLWS